jgi:hypothetical protein
MNDQQSDEISQKISELIGKFKKWELKYSIKDLEDLLNKIYRKVQEKANLHEIKKSYTFIDLHYDKYVNELLLGGYYHIKTHIYSKDEVIECYSYIKYLSSKIRCTNYIDKSFELSDTIYFIKGIKEKILDINDILYPEALKNLSKQFIDIKVDASMYLNRPIKNNSEIEISKDGNLFIYNNGRSKIKIIWRFY